MNRTTPIYDMVLADFQRIPGMWELFLEKRRGTSLDPLVSELESGNPDAAIRWLLEQPADFLASPTGQVAAALAAFVADDAAEFNRRIGFK